MEAVCLAAGGRLRNLVTDMLLEAFGDDEIRCHLAADAARRRRRRR